MTVLTRCLLSKSNLAGWEVMELFAGGVNQSDKFFNVSRRFVGTLDVSLKSVRICQEFATVVGTLLGDDNAPGMHTPPHVVKLWQVVQA
jgi:hypothetical protein